MGLEFRGENKPKATGGAKGTPKTPEELIEILREAANKAKPTDTPEQKDEKVGNYLDGLMSDDQRKMVDEAEAVMYDLAELAYQNMKAAEAGNIDPIQVVTFAMAVRKTVEALDPAQIGVIISAGVTALAHIRMDIEEEDGKNG